MPTVNFTANSEILAFVEYFSVSLNKSKRTAKEYARDIARFERFIAPSGAALVDATTQQIEAWRDHLLAEGRNQPQSVCRKLAAVAAFFKWRKKKKMLSGRDNPYDGVDKPKCARPLPKVMSEEEVQILLGAPMIYRRYGAFLEPRNRAIMQLLYASGVRRFEATALDLSDVDLERGRVRVRHGKGDKERYTFMNGPAIAAIQEYLQVRNLHERADSPPALFLTINGDRLSPRELWAVFNAYRKVAKSHGLEKHVVPHTMRHSFATHIYRRSRNIRAVQKMLGHSSINITERYTHVEDDELAEIYASSHPGGMAA